MANQKVLNIGAVANDGNGDTLRDAGDKINYNFGQLFTRHEVQQISATGSIDEGASYIFANSPNVLVLDLLAGLEVGDIKRFVNSSTSNVIINGTILQGTSVTMSGKGVCAFIWTGTHWALLTDDNITIT
jgi:hypothetical protein